MEKYTVLQTHAADTELRFEFLILATAHCALPPEPHAPPAPSSLYQIVLMNYSHSKNTQTHGHTHTISNHWVINSLHFPSCRGVSV